MSPFIKIVVCNAPLSGVLHNGSLYDTDDGSGSGMVTQVIVEAALGSVASVYSLVEDNFLTAGEHLAGVVEDLGTLKGNFRHLIEVLEGDEVLGAAGALARAADDLRSIYGTITGEAPPLEQLAHWTGTVMHAAQRMQSIVGEVSALAINARLAAVAIDSDDVGLASFSSEIRRSSSVAQHNLAAFSKVLEAVSRNTAATVEQHRVFDGRHRTTVGIVPQRIAANLKAVQEHRVQARASAVRMDQRSRAMEQRVGIAVGALQFGDITRQRIEHAKFALDTAARILNGARPDAAAPDHLALVCRIAAAQFLDMADEFEGESRRVSAALAALVPEAADFSTAGRAAAAGGGKADFLEALTEDVRITMIVLDEMQSARAATAQSVANVMQQIDILHDHLRLVHAAEAEIHIMGLNTTLKCGRLGNRGRPMSVIAQALRSCGSQTAAQVHDVRGNLQKMKEIAKALASSTARDGADAAPDTAHAMRDAVRGLTEAAEQANAALAPMASVSEHVMHLLDKCIKGFAVHERICDVLRKTGKDLSACAESAASPAETKSAGIDAALDAIGACYTMQRERDVHNRACGGLHISGTASTAAPAVPLAEQDLEDMLF